MAPGCRGMQKLTFTHPQDAVLQIWHHRTRRARCCSKQLHFLRRCFLPGNMAQTEETELLTEAPMAAEVKEDAPTEEVKV